MAPPSKTSPVSSPQLYDEPWDQFARWACQQLHVELTDEAAPRISIPEQELLQGNLATHITENHADETAQSLTKKTSSKKRDNPYQEIKQVQIPLASPEASHWLHEKIRPKNHIFAAAPLVQPVAVYEITTALYSAYQVDGGKVQLGGCHLEDRPFLRLTFQNPKNNDTVQHVFVSAEGSSVSDILVNELGLSATAEAPEQTNRSQTLALAPLLTSGRRIFTQHHHQGDTTALPQEPLAVTVVWAKYGIGHLDFIIGEEQVSLEFSGWANNLRAPKFVCPHTGTESYHVVSTDTGLITVAEEIGVCEKTSQRLLKTELVECAVTGKTINRELTKLCPVLSKPALLEKFTSCPSCHESVCEAAIRNKTCQACQNLTKIEKSDPRVVWILGEHPSLEAWKKWKLIETQSVYLIEVSSWLSRLRIVLDRETYQLKHLTHGRAPFFKQQEVPADQWQEHLSN